MAEPPAPRARSESPAVQNERDRLQRLFQAAPAAVVVLRGPDHRVALVNPVARQFIGWGRDILGRPAREAVPELEQQGYLRIADQVYATGQPFVADEARVLLDRRGDGALEEAFFNVVFQPTHDAKGRVDGIFVHGYEVTEQVRARAVLAESQAALMQSRDELRAILESVADGVMVQDAGGRILYANAAAARLCGFSSVEEFLATPMADVLARFSLIDEAGRPFPLGRLPARLALNGVPASEAVVGFRSSQSGEERWAISRARPVTSPDGQVRFAVSAFQDITAVKRQEVRERFLAEAGEILSGSLDPATTLQNVAQLAVPRFADWCVVHLVDGDGAVRAVAMAHSDPQKLALARDLETRFPPPPDAIAGHAKVIRTGEPDWIPDITELIERSERIDAEQLRLVRGLQLRSSLSAPLRAGDRVLGAITFTTAESGRRYTAGDLALAEEVARRAAVALENARLYDASRTALAETAAALAARDRFLSMASHELRTPLTSLFGYVELAQRRLARGADPPALASLLAQARAQAVNLDRLIGELLDVSRILAGRFPIKPVPLALAPLLQHAVQLARAIEPSRTIELALPPEMPEVEADASRLEQLLSILLENASKYSPAEAPVHVVAAVRPGAVTVAVRDEGIGIPPDDLAHVFEPFHRAGNIDERNLPGLGLGLYLAHEIAVAHGGTLTVESEPSRGSTFTLSLPPRSSS